jgi:hypothetical protein
MHCQSYILSLYNNMANWNNNVYSDLSGGTQVAFQTAPVITETNTVPPETPENFIATISNGTASLSWNANPESDLDHYNIYLNGSLNSQPKSGVASYQLTLPSGTYTLQISAIDGSGNESIPTEGTMITSSGPSSSSGSAGSSSSGSSSSSSSGGSFSSGGGAYVAPVATTTATTTISIPGCPKSFTCTPAVTVGGGSIAGPLITKYLYSGMSDQQVLYLQKLLNGNGYPVALSGAGSLRNEIERFGPATTAALEKLQCAALKLCSGVSVINGYGATGTSTRAILNALPHQPVVGAAPAAAVAASSFTRNLTVGSVGADVQALQQFLNGHGFTVSSSGNGSPGHETTYFGPATQAALARFQKAEGISPAAGYFGAITRGVMERS